MDRNEFKDNLKREGGGLLIALVICTVVAWVTLSLAFGYMVNAGVGWLVFALGWVVATWRVWVLLKAKALEIKNAKGDESVHGTQTGER